MSSIGGAFFGKPMPPKGDENPREIVRQFAIVCGKVTSDQTAKMSHNENVVTFWLKYGEKPSNANRGERRKGKRDVEGEFIRCTASDADHPGIVAAVVSAIKKRDTVLCAGRTTTRMRQTRNGQIKEIWLTVDAVFLQDSSSFLMRMMDFDYQIPIGIDRMLMAIWNHPDLRRMILEQDAKNELPDEFEG